MVLGEPSVVSQTLRAKTKSDTKWSWIIFTRGYKLMTAGLSVSYGLNSQKQFQIQKQKYFINFEIKQSRWFFPKIDQMWIDIVAHWLPAACFLANAIISYEHGCIRWIWMPTGMTSSLPFLRHFFRMTWSMNTTRRSRTSSPCVIGMIFGTASKYISRNFDLDSITDTFNLIRVGTWVSVRSSYSCFHNTTFVTASIRAPIDSVPRFEDLTSLIVHTETGRNWTAVILLQHLRKSRADRHRQVGLKNWCQNYTVRRINLEQWKTTISFTTIRWHRSRH